MKRVFIISNHSMFGHGLNSLLSQEAGIDIVGQATEVGRAIEQIKELQPDVVILDSDNPPYNTTSEVMRILRMNPRIKVVGLNLQNNDLYSYRARQWVARSVEDLLDALEDDWPSFGRAGRESSSTEGENEQLSWDAN